MLLHLVFTCQNHAVRDAVGSVLHVACASCAREILCDLCFLCSWDSVYMISSAPGPPVTAILKMLFKGCCSRHAKVMLT